MNADRKRRAKAALEFCHVMARDKNGRAIKVRVSGHLGKMHEVILRWQEHTISVECRIDTGLGYVSCPGQSFVCYHGLAAVIYACREQGYRVSVGALADLKRLKNLGGTIIAIQSWVSGQGVRGETIWAMLSPIKQNRPVVHHVDGDLTNNRLDNLQLVNIRENRRESEKINEN